MATKKSPKVVKLFSVKKVTKKSQRKYKTYKGLSFVFFDFETLFEVNFEGYLRTKSVLRCTLSL